MATVIADQIAELEADRVRLAPLLEGLEDLARLNLVPSAASSVADQIARTKRLIEKEESALAALEALVSIGYPDDLRSEVTEAVLADLQMNRDSVDEAFRLFRASEAVAGSIRLVPA